MESDIKPDISPVTDGGEAVALMEPMLIVEGSAQRGELTDLAIEVAARSAGFRRSLPPATSQRTKIIWPVAISPAAAISTDGAI